MLDGGQCDLPASEILGVRLGLVAERGCLAHDPVGRRGLLRSLPGPFGPLLEVIRRAQPAQCGERQHRGRQRELHLSPPPLLDRPRHGHGALALGRLHPLLHARQVGRDPLGHDIGVSRAVLGLDRQAVLGQGDQLALGPAAVQPGQCIGRVAPGRLAEDLGRGTPREGRRTR